MDLILHIRICNDAFNFNEPLSIKGAQYIDIDNFSDGAMIDTVNSAIDLSEKLLVFVQIDGAYEIGLLMNVLQKLMKHKRDHKILHIGEHEKTAKVLMLMGSKEVSKENFIEEAKSYFI